MQIQNVSDYNNTTFGLYYDGFLTQKHRAFLKPVVSKICNLGKNIDIDASSQMRIVERCGDAAIYSECIEFVVAANERSPFKGLSQKVRVFTNKFANESEAKLQAVREKVVTTLNAAVKKATSEFSPKDVSTNAIDELQKVFVV